MFKPIGLTADEIEICERTISPTTFYMLVGNALVNAKSLSVVRMADGERELINTAREGNLDDPITIKQPDPEAWLKKMGCLGLSKRGLIRRLETAANECTYFAPSMSGLQQSNYNVYHLFNPRDRYVDSFFHNVWTEEMKIELFKTAKHVLFIHRNTASADAMQIRAKWALGVKVTYLKMERWEQSEEVIEKASGIAAPLVLFSAGPASKYIGTRISRQGIPKVTLDIGQSADLWLLNSLKDIPNGRR